MTLEEKVITHLEIRSDLTKDQIREMLEEVDDKQRLAWIIMAADDVLIPALSTPEGKIEGLTSPIFSIRKRSEELLQDDFEFTLALYRARNGLEWN